MALGDLSPQFQMLSAHGTRGLPSRGVNNRRFHFHFIPVTRQLLAKLSGIQPPSISLLFLS